MSSFKKMRLVPYESVEAQEPVVKNEQIKNDLENRIANILKSNLEEESKVAIIKALMNKTETEKKPKQIISNRSLMTPKPKKRRQQEDAEFLKSLEWTQF